VLKLFPDPKKVGNSGFAIAGCNVIRPETEYYGEDLVKRLALAEAKIIVGTIREKFNGTALLGGGTINTNLKDDGKTERNDIITEIKTLYNRPFGFMVE
jgi:hypothetical protein